MSFNAPPPPPQPMFPEFGPEPTPPKKSKGPAIIIGAVAVVVLGALIVGATWFLNKAAKPDTMARPTVTQTADNPSDQPSDKPSDQPSDQPSDKPSDQPAEKPKPTPSAAPEWSQVPTPSPTPPPVTVTATATEYVPAPKTESVEEYRQAERVRLSNRFCKSGNIVVIAETAKHYVSICDVDGSTYYRGEGKKSGGIMNLPAYGHGGGGSSYEASNSSTDYYFDRYRLTVSSGSKVQLDDPIISYRYLGYGSWED